MLHKLLPIFCIGALAFGSVACKSKPKPLKPGELSQVEKDKLRLTAINAYGRIVKDFKESPHYAEAEARLKVLQPAKKK